MRQRSAAGHPPEAPGTMCHRSQGSMLLASPAPDPHPPTAPALPAGAAEAPHATAGVAIFGLAKRQEETQGRAGSVRRGQTHARAREGDFRGGDEALSRLTPPGVRSQKRGNTMTRACSSTGGRHRGPKLQRLRARRLRLRRKVRLHPRGENTISKIKS